MRTLRRPLFRGGSTGTGITSGLAPRQGYAHEPGHVVKDDWRKKKMSEWNPTLGEVMDVSKQIGSQPRGTNVYDFLTEFGLDIASRPPQGNIFQTAAASAKEPYQRFLARKSAADVQGAESQADMFKMLMEGAIGKDKSYAHRDKAAMVRENMDKQYAVIDQINALDPKAADYEDQRQKLTRNLRKLKEQVSGDEFAKAQLKYWSEDQNSRKLDRLIRLEIGKLLNLDPDTTFEENREFAEAFIKRRNEIMNDIRLGISPTFNFAAGGRVRYANAGPVMGQPTQADAMPEELSGISYEELRARLPQEVSDEVVKLLANSAEALEDFATIQTEQDIANFNKKYGVNLVLPAEG
jgi:hypothetical protein